MLADISGGTRAVARCRMLGVTPFSDIKGGLLRAYLTPAYRAAQEQLAEWMQAAGMTTRIDAAGNLMGRYEGLVLGARALMIASHLDSVRDGGVFDGPLGILLGVECVAALHNGGRRLPFAIEIYAFGDEEGSRFPAAMLTSRAVAGILAAEELDVADAQGVWLSEEVDIHAYLAAARRPDEFIAYLEAHIEQGPTLESEDLALGTVSGIAAQLRFQAVVRGVAGHAGTNAMGLRRDALAGAAQMVLAVEAIARADASDLVATVGLLEVAPGAPNVVAGTVRFTIDVRSGEAARRDRAAENILADLRGIAAGRHLELAVELIHDLPACPCSPVLMDLLNDAVVASGQRPFRLVSGAGHDAMNLAAIMPTAMLFIRCREGISHNPAEHVEPDDAEAALAVMLGFIEKLGETCA